MNPTLLMGLIALRAAALGVALAGDLKQSDRLYLLADLLEAGSITDAHLQVVANKLKDRGITDEDWDQVLSRIDASSATLHGAG